MKKLDQFIVKAFIGPFIAILLVVIFILMMQFLWLYIDELVGKGLGVGVILEFMMWGGFTILPLAIPLATLLASMMTIGQMAENNELLAIKASGVSLWRVMVPVMFCSAVICVGTFFASDNLVPKAYDEIMTLRDDIKHTKDEIKIPVKTFYAGIEGYVLRVEERDDKTGMMYDVMVYDHTAGKGNVSITVADSAEIRMSRDKDFLTFSMYSGTNFQETNTMQYRDTTLELNKVDFSRQRIMISLENYSFQKSDSTRFSDEVKAMSLAELREYHDSLSTQLARFHRDHVRGLLKNSEFDFNNQLDSSYLKKGLRPMELPDELTWESNGEKLRAYENASTRARNIKGIMESYGREIYHPRFFILRTAPEIYRKYATALTCIILFFIGAPLGAIIRKGGLGVSAIVSALFFVLYYILDIVGFKLAKDGSLPASAGAFLSPLIMLILGIYLTVAAIKDTSILNFNLVKIGWRRLVRRFKGMFNKTRIVYMGTPEFAVAPLDALIKKGYDVVGVVTVADKPSGRGLKMNESAVKKYAVEHNIPVLQPVKLKDPEFLEALKAWKADLFVVVAFRMLPEEVWAMPKLGTFNLHAALLPQYRGAAPINWAVINGEKITGVTTFMIDHDIDTGGIILRADCRIEPEDTAGDVHDKLMDMGAGLVVETVEGIIQKNVELRVQRSFIQGSEVLKPAPKLHRELCHIDWDDTTKQVFNLIRGLSPYPTAFTEIYKDSPDTALQLKIFKAEKMEADAAPGTILSDGKTYLAIATSDGAISIRELQLSGKKRMNVEDFLKGFREPESYKTTKGTSKAEIAKTR